MLEMTPRQYARMFPPGHGKFPSVKINGRTYTATVGNYIDVPAFDASLLSANGWTRFGGTACTIGPTLMRPTTASGGQPLAVGQTFYDTTLNTMVTWDQLANVWRGPTGAVV